MNSEYYWSTPYILNNKSKKSLLFYSFYFEVLQYIYRVPVCDRHRLGIILSPIGSGGTGGLKCLSYRSACHIEVSFPS